MTRKTTNDLQEDLFSAPNLDQFLTENQESFKQESLQQLLEKMMAEKKLSKATLAKRSGMSEIYLHQIFAGRRNPSRSRLICLCYGMEATVEETQNLLKLCGMAQLYPRLRRDAILLYGLSHGIDLFEINDRLFAEDEETLY